MNFIEQLATLEGVLTGKGLNREGESFDGRMEILSLVSGAAIFFHYTATRDDGLHLHAESTLLGVGESGKLCLWPVMEELPAVIPHAELTQSHGSGHSVVFATGSRDGRDTFRAELTLSVEADGALKYAHAWGLPGGDFDERSWCTLYPAR